VSDGTYSDLATWQRLDAAHDEQIIDQGLYYCAGGIIAPAV
jgi:hypothetical protein